LRSEKFSEFLTIEFLPIGPPFKTMSSINYRTINSILGSNSIPVSKTRLKIFKLRHILVEKIIMTCRVDPTSEDSYKRLIECTVT